MSSVRRSTPPHIAWLIPAWTLFFMCGILIGRSVSTWQPLLAALALSVGAVGLFRSWRRMAALMLAILCCGSLLAWRTYNPALPDEGDYAVTGAVVDTVVLEEDGHVRTVLDGVSFDGKPFPGRAYWTYYLKTDEILPEELVPGAQVTMTAQLYHPEGRSNPDGYDFRESLLQQGITVGVYGADELTFTDLGFSLTGTMARFRHVLTLSLLDVMGEEHGAYAVAMLLGNRDFIADDDIVAFKKLGVAHILSVSGYHVGVLAGLLILLMLPMHLPRWLRVLLEGVILALYSLLAGGNAPIIRAALLLMLREVTRLMHRQPGPLHLLCVAAAVQLAFSPAQLTSASFQLTYCAMLGLLLIYPRLRKRRLGRTRWGCRIWDAFCPTLSAQIGILLPQLYWFCDLPLLSLVLNMGVTFFFSLLMALYWVTLAALPVPVLREFLGTAASAATALLLFVVRTLAELDCFSLWTRRADVLTAVGWVLLMLGLSILLPEAWRKRRRWLTIAGTLLIALILVPLPQKDTELIQFDVGSADAALLQDQGQVVVIDTGEDGQALAGYLHAHRLSIDTLILTHLHEDHAGGLQALLDKEIPVTRCCLPVDALAVLADEGLAPLLNELTAAGTELCFLSRGDVLTLPSGSIEVLWPPESFARPGSLANLSCLALRLDVGGVSLLYAGDLPGSLETYIQTPADILKVAHHGSTESTSDAFLAAVNPQLLLLSNGNSARTARVEALADGTPLYATETSGAIVLRFSGDGCFTVEPFLDP